MIDWTINKNNVILAEQFYNELILPNIDLFNSPLLKHSYFTAPQNDNIEIHSYSIRSIQEKIDIYLLIDVEKNTNKIKVKNFTLTDFDSICLWCLLDNSEYKRNILIQHLKVIEKCIGEKYNTVWVDTIINHRELLTYEMQPVKAANVFINLPIWKTIKEKNISIKEYKITELNTEYLPTFQEFISKTVYYFVLEINEGDMKISIFYNTCIEIDYSCPTHTTTKTTVSATSLYGLEKREEYYSNGYNDKVVGYKRVIDFLNNFINKLEKTLDDNTHVQQI